MEKVIIFENDIERFWRVEENKERIIKKIHQMGFLISQNIEQGRLDCWIDLNLTMSQLKSLIYIEFQENVCIRDLSRTLKIAQPNVTHLVDFLVKNRLVRRKENPGDRRLLILKNTPKGKKLIAALRDSISTEMSGYLVQLSLEQIQALAEGISPLAKLMQDRQNQNNPRPVSINRSKEEME
jgi:DNA-binding MarR family transcriptional regulator